jgi:hypothetical protein
VGSVPGWVGLMTDEYIDLTVRVKITGPLSSECVDLIRRDINGMCHLEGTGDSLSGAMVMEVR